MFMRIERYNEPFAFINLNVAAITIRAVPMKDGEGDDAVPNGKYLCAVNAATGDIQIAVCQDARECNLIGEALHAALCHGVTLFDMRIAQAYIESARLKKMMGKIELTNLVMVASKLTWDEFQKRMSAAEKPVADAGS